MKNMGEEIEIRYISEKHYEYPEKLKNLTDRPKGLYRKGRLPEPGKPAVAIVGARNCTVYGARVAEYFAFELAKAGVEIISGLASGIDTAAHYGALQAGGVTYGILGSGVDVCYPKSNQKLYEKMLEKGGIISEYEPGTKPLPYHFPLRNRIISGLSDLVLVVEAREKSGSLITADLAMEQGKDVFAVPGGIFEALSKGCNRLISQGAGIATEPQDVLNAIGLNCENWKNNFQKNDNLLATKEKLVYSHLCLFPKTIDELVRETELPLQQILEILMELEMEGYAREIAKNHFVREK